MPASLLACAGAGGASGSAFTPSSIAGLKLWLRADAGVYSDAGVTPAVNTSPVAQWNDQSGLGNHLTQATSSKRPTFLTGVQNGLPGLRFDATDDAMTLPLPLNLVVPYTLIVMEKPQAGGGGVRTVNSGSANRIVSVGRSTGANAFLGSPVSGYSPGDTNAHIASLVVAAGGASYYVDGVDRTTTTGVTGDWPELTLGGFGLFSEPANTDLFEVFAYDTGLTTPQRGQVQSYLGTKYGITVV